MDLTPSCPGRKIPKAGSRSPLDASCCHLGSTSHILGATRSLVPNHSRPSRGILAARAWIISMQRGASLHIFRLSLCPFAIRKTLVMIRQHELADDRVIVLNVSARRREYEPEWISPRMLRRHQAFRVPHHVMRDMNTDTRTPLR